MKTTQYILSSVFILLPVVLLAQDPSALFSEAEQQYDEGEYTGAVETYQQILRQGVESASLHYNLGNAYFKSGEIGEAILHYEKAAKLSPRDPDIRYNLKIARARIQDRITPPPVSFLMKVYNGMKYWLALNELAWATGALFLLTSLLFAGRHLFRYEQLRKISRSLFIVGIGLLILTVPLLVSRTLEASQEKYGIVLDPEIKVYSAPQTISTEVFVIHEGTRVRVEQEQDNWFRIRLADGKEGWVQVPTVGVI